MTAMLCWNLLASSAAVCDAYDNKEKCGQLSGETFHKHVGKGEKKKREKVVNSVVPQQN